DELASRAPSRPVRVGGQREPGHRARRVLRHERLRQHDRGDRGRCGRARRRPGEARRPISGHGDPPERGAAPPPPVRERPALPAGPDRDRLRRAPPAGTAGRDGPLPGRVPPDVRVGAARSPRRPARAHRRLVPAAPLVCAAVRDVSVVVPFRDAERHVGRCLRALEGQLPFGGTYEVVMVDDGSTDGSAGIVAGFPSARLLSLERRSAYAARNRGVAASTGATIAFTDSDCEPRPDWLERIGEAMTEPSVAVVVGARRPAGRSPVLSLVAAYERAKDEFIFASRIPDLYYGSANNMAVRREIFERFGPFSERPRGSDALFVRRVVEALSPDAVRFLPELHVDHLEIATVRDYYRKVYVYGRG